MIDQTKRREYIERARVIIGHLIESGDLPRDLADDLQILIEMALMWEIGDMLRHNHMLRAFTDAHPAALRKLKPEELSADELRRLRRDMADAVHLLDFGKKLVAKQLRLLCPPGPFPPSPFQPSGPLPAIPEMTSGQLRLLVKDEESSGEETELIIDRDVPLVVVQRNLARCGVHIGEDKLKALIEQAMAPADGSVH
jgi:hypothetical protein